MSKQQVTPKVTFVNELDINKLLRGLEKILSDKYDAEIKITATKKETKEGA